MLREVTSRGGPRERAPRRVQVLPPAGRDWLPGLPDPGLPDLGADAALVPVAAFSGRRLTLPLRGGEGGDPLSATLRLGKLRAVAAERPVARLTLTGAAVDVLALARALAETLPLLPPAAALAEEARALARGEAPRPRRTGAPALADAPSVEAAFVTAVGHLLAVMLHQAPACRPGAGAEGVHQMRVALRRLRSVLRAFRPAAHGPSLDRFDARLRDLGRVLGPARDLDVFLAGLGARLARAFPGDRRMAALLRAAETRRTAAYAALGVALDGPDLRALMLDGIALCAQRPWRGETEGDAGAAERRAEPLAAFAGRLLDRRWDKLREEGAEIGALDDGALHELRLEAKKLRYAAELFTGLWGGKAARRFLKRLSAAQEALGQANDVAVARALVASLAPGVPAWAVGAAEGFAVAGAGDARSGAHESWAHLGVAKPFWDED